ncbi:MAG TPA: hypothetical protein PKK31_08800, partial [Elusimicrobiales bacterium]|nr:hypothetical protein [Elusimicrobiales bacterium]
RSGYNGCPTHVYFACRLEGRSAEEVFDSGERLFGALDPVVGPVIDFELLQNSLASAKDLGDFDHPPRLAPAAGPAELRLSLSPGAGRARDAADAALYSPGPCKRLELAAAENDPPDALRRLAAYSLMKARLLGKKVRLAVAAGAD